MNICYLSREYPPNIIGGVGTYTFEIAQAMTKLGHRAYVITEAIGKEGENIEEGVHLVRVKNIFSPVPFFLREKIATTLSWLEYSYVVSNKLKEIVRKYKIDIVESCEFGAEGFWYYLFNRYPPLAIKLHTPARVISEINNLPVTVDSKVKEMLEEWWLLRADKIVSVTKAIGELLSRRYRFNFDYSEPVYYPINTELFIPKRYAGVAEVPKILYAGRLELRKGPHVLLEAVPSVLKYYPNSQFYFVGADWGLKSIMEERIKELGCASNIIFVNQVKREEMVMYYQNSDICVFPSLWENFAYVALEAMSCGKAVIASRVGGFCEMINDGINGILCFPNNPDDLAEKIIYALSDASLIEKIGLAARHKIIENYSEQERARKMEKIYKQVVGNG